ncbi:hypothetical protein J3458_020519 [Metarhizium acridum]|uniref:uncharacterized protein n=1 Tax=Metarhizium acridum TaxID=92637 RepID=UPI001C6AA44D|nr:hypothetical protein J3458_020519 [Metarhizium acridum]
MSPRPTSQALNGVAASLPPHHDRSTKDADNTIQNTCAPRSTYPASFPCLSAGPIIQDQVVVELKVRGSSAVKALICLPLCDMSRSGNISFGMHSQQNNGGG